MNRILQCKCSAPAKINLGLEVLRRRPDGYHDINTLFATVSVYDELIIRLNTTGTLSCTVSGSDTLEADDTNLCIRAAKALREHAGTDLPGLDIELIKRIPIGAGLGGGSSDAASVLATAARIWGLDLTVEELQGIGRMLGSDVPFFLIPGVALGTSRGEMLRRISLDLSHYTVLLVNPGIHISTPEAYHAVNRTNERRASDLVLLLRRGLKNPELLRNELVNDFEPPIFAEHPLLAEIKESLYCNGASFALLSGSGSTLYGLFDRPEQAECAADSFLAYWCRTAQFISSPLSPKCE